jgi:uncharacterized protein (DUF302 family)
VGWSLSGAGRRDERKIMTNFPDNGMVHVSSPRTAAETLARVEAVVKSKGVRIHAVIDHSGDAAAAGLTMRPTQVVIFGNAAAGTPLMVAAPTLAIDLPLKVLVWEDDEGRVWLSYNSPEYLKKRHGIPEDLLKNIAAVKVIAEEAAR